jgi:hypothetical protein
MGTFKNATKIPGMVLPKCFNAATHTNLVIGAMQVISITFILWLQIFYMWCAFFLCITKMEVNGTRVWAYFEVLSGLFVYILTFLPKQQTTIPKIVAHGFLMTAAIDMIWKGCDFCIFFWCNRQRIPKSKSRWLYIFLSGVSRIFAAACICCICFLSYVWFNDVTRCAIVYFTIWLYAYVVVFLSFLWFGVV